MVGSSIGAGACANVKRSGKIYKIDDTTKMLHFLSEENNVEGANDWLYTVIEDIVSSRGMYNIVGEPKQAVQRSINHLCIADYEWMQVACHAPITTT